MRHAGIVKRAERLGEKVHDPCSAAAPSPPTSSTPLPVCELARLALKGGLAHDGRLSEGARAGGPGSRVWKIMRDGSA